MTDGVKPTENDDLSRTSWLRMLPWYKRELSIIVNKLIIYPSHDPWRSMNQKFRHPLPFMCRSFDFSGASLGIAYLDSSPTRWSL